MKHHLQSRGRQGRPRHPSTDRAPGTRRERGSAQPPRPPEQGAGQPCGRRSRCAAANTAREKGNPDALDRCRPKHANMLLKSTQDRQITACGRFWPCAAVADEESLAQSSIRPCRPARPTSRKLKTQRPVTRPPSTQHCTKIWGHKIKLGASIRKSEFSVSLSYLVTMWKV